MALTWSYSCADESGEDRRENNLFRAIKLLGEPIRTVDIYIIITAEHFIENRYGGYTLTLFGLFIFILLIYSLIFHIRTNRECRSKERNVSIWKSNLPIKASPRLVQVSHFCKNNTPTHVSPEPFRRRQKHETVVCYFPALYMVIHLLFRSVRR